jgi:hypothetical protein
MDVFSAYSYQNSAFNRGTSGSRSRNQFRPYSTPAKCQAESFKPFINPITKDVKESWESCSKKATGGDVLCSVHRKMLNNACAHGGLVQNKTNVRVPFEAVDKGGCAFPASFIADATSKGAGKKAAGTKFFTDLKFEKFEINNRDHIKNAFLSLHGV